ncbi:MAG TPA: TIGR03986 family CRISPR-associated RAMP protein, partial [Gammaproteobacteria bacterium]|nr:TIGR03986 family CRISPR-associated RAMP protein [Gammaproteobacteria bacterium]
LPDGRYAIPGSSLKGLIRAVVEIAGFGRMRMVDDIRPGLRDISGKYVKDAYQQRARGVRPGFLRRDNDGKLTIIPCQMTRLPLNGLRDALGLQTPVFDTGASVRDKYRRWCDLCAQHGWNPERLRFDLQGDSATNLGAGSLEGTPVFTGQIHGKKKDFIFHHTPRPEEPIPVSDDDWRNFLFVHGNDKSATEGRDLSWPGYWKEKFREGSDVPVFYIKEGPHIRIGLAYLPKLAGDFGTHDCIRNSCPEHLDTQPAPGTYDLADLLFGSTNSDDQNAALRGRVSFQTALACNSMDARAEDDTILNSPKPSYFPNYLVQETDGTGMYLQEGTKNVQYFTYLSSPTNKNPRLRGFKRYPARHEFGVQRLTPDQETNRAVQIKLHTLGKGATFEGTILFHNLKPEELGALLWALTWGGDPGLRHGLGMGKPFGFGQVRFEIDGASSILVPNDLSQRTIPLNEDKQKALMAEFERHMEKAAEQHGGWKHSPQIRNLLAMADPEAANDLPHGMELRHMRILRCQRNGKRVNGNEFVWAEQKAMVLADYADATGWPGEATKKRWHAAQSDQVAQELASSDIHPWLQEQLNAVLSESHASDLDALMRHNKLFKKWKSIGDPELKRETLEIIKAYWEERNWWQNPDNKSMRQLRDKYEREAKKL